MDDETVDQAADALALEATLVRLRADQMTPDELAKILTGDEMKFARKYYADTFKRALRSGENPTIPPLLYGFVIQFD